MIYFPRWKIITIFLIVGLAALFAAPNLMSRATLDSLPSWLPKWTINLGLDLQGGAHLAFLVEADAVVVERLNGLEDEVRRALRGDDPTTRIGYRDLRANDEAVTVRVRDLGDMDGAVERIRELSSPVNSSVGGFTGARDIEVRGDTTTGVIRVTLTEPAIRELRESAIRQSIEIIRTRIDQLGTREPTIQREGDDRIIVQVPGESEPQRIIDIVGRTAKMTFHMHETSTPVADVIGNNRPPPGTILVPTDRPEEPFILLEKRVVVSGEHLNDAQPSPNQDYPGEWQISFRFDSAGARRFAQATKSNVGRRFAIVLDNKVITAPRIQTPILTGDGRITGDFTPEEANDLAILMRAGALPAPLTPVEQRTVGPDLGADSIAAGRMASIIGFVAVIVFMALSYGRFGLYANVALIANMILIAAMLSVLGATLTLPGIAGIVLTIGMAVDANVLIFERIREEVRTGKTPLAAVEAGFQKALGTILDANITTFIAAVILFQLGSGPIRGFAVTLAIGILTSVFSAFTLTRLLVATYLRRRRPQVLPI